MTFQTAIGLVAAHAKDHPNTVAMRQKRYGIWQEYTWPMVEEIAHDLAAALIADGLAPGAKVGILSENRREWVLAQMGVQAAGAVTVGMYATSPAEEIAHFIEVSDVEVLFIEDQEQFDKIVELEDRLFGLKKLVVFEAKGLGGETFLNLESYDNLLTRGRAEDRATEIAARIAGLAPQDTSLMVFTSGSTGKPKAAEISHANMAAQFDLISWAFGDVPAGTNLLSYLPLNHIAEQAVTVMGALSGPRVMNFGESLRTITLDLRDVAPEAFFGVPRIWEKMQAGLQVQAQTAGPLRRMLIGLALKSAATRHATPRPEWSAMDELKHRFWDLFVYRHMRSYLGLGRCSFAISAAAPISLDLLQFFRGIGVNLREFWGMTETSGAVTAQADWGAGQGRVGFFPDGTEWKIAEDGELLIKGNIVFKGYYKRPDATAETIVDGWLHTGDVAEAFDDGSISIIDRKKDIMINAAGKNLSPSEIENTMKASPLIKECVVIGDQKPYVTALIQIDFDTVRIWAEANGVTYTTFKSLAEHPKVIDLIEAEVDKRNASLARVAQIKKVRLLNKELDHDDGEVTATMKIRRSKIAEGYAKEIEALYA
ncbi:MAG: long-chain fatty acid--CoA ligase [Pseudomonadota bacterium]